MSQISTGGGGGGSWGSITGTLSDQTDLQSALDAKVGDTGNESVAGVKTFSDGIVIGGGVTASTVKFMEPSGSGTNYSTFKAQAQAANLDYTLPPSHTTNGYLKNDGSGGLTWATVTTDFTTVGDGTVSAPGLAFGNDTNSGLYSPAADTPAIAAGGKEIGRFYSSGSFGVLKLGFSDTEGGKLLLSNNANAGWVSTVGSGIGVRIETPNTTGIRMKVNSVECFEFYDTLMFAYKPIKLVDNATATASGAQVVLNAYDVSGSAGRRSLALGTEEAVVTETVTSDRTLAVTINGTAYKICLKA